MDDITKRHGELRGAVEQIGEAIYDILTSPRLWKAIIKILIVSAFAVTAYNLSVLAYAAFYHFHLPDQIVTVPVHLQYGYGPNPFAVASLDWGSLKNAQDYDVSIALTVPHSRENLERGNFMVGLMLLADSEPTRRVSHEAPPRYHDGKTSPFIVPPVDIAAYAASKRVLHASTRATRVPYQSWLVSEAASLLRLPYNALWPGAETSTLVVRMAERLTFARGTPLPGNLLIEIQAGQSLQVYDAAVTLTAQLTGLRYFMYQYRLTAFLLFTGMFWVVCMLSFSVVFMLPLSFLLEGGGQGVKEEGSDVGAEDDAPVIKKEEGDLSDNERTFPSSSKHPALKFEGRVKQEEGEEEDVPPPVNPGVEADDEDDEEDDWRARDSGIGTSFSDNRSRQGARRRISASAEGTP